MLSRRTQPLRVHRLDRLYPLIGLLLLLGCGARPKQEEAAQMSRVAAVKADPGSAASSAEKWCDVSWPSAGAPQLKLPPAVPARQGGVVPAPPQDRWVWLNVWATWCGPCIKEMPMMEQWKAQFHQEGVEFDLWYLSVDEQEEALRRFLQQRPSLAPGNSARIAELKHLGPWLKQYQLDAELAAIPIHMLVAPGGAVRCVHVGQLREGDYRVLKELMQ